MTRKIAVAVIHGIGRRVPNFADRISLALNERCRDICGDALVIRSVYWAPVLQDEEDMLWDRVQEGGELDFKPLRRLMVDFVADALAYQITPHDRAVYDDIHGIFAETLNRLALEAGPDAPLVIIAHSLGTVVASNYIYDLQTEPTRPILPMTVREAMDNTPLEKGETLALFYTLGSPIALWSLRFSDFGKPITVPDPRIRRYYPNLRGEWVNFYDKDDIVGFPLKTLNDAYARVVTEDLEVDVGDMLTSWNPMSHMGYWEDWDVIEPMARSIIRLWQSINPGRS